MHLHGSNEYSLAAVPMQLRLNLDVNEVVELVYLQGDTYRWL
jgi:hypothetical protein